MPKAPEQDFYIMLAGTSVSKVPSRETEQTIFAEETYPHRLFAESIARLAVQPLTWRGNSMLPSRSVFRVAFDGEPSLLCGKDHPSQIRHSLALHAPEQQLVRVEDRHLHNVILAKTALL